MKRLITNRSEEKQDNIYISDDEIITETVQDCSGILKANRDLRSLGRNTKAHTAIAASVPITLHRQWVKEWKKNHSDKWKLGTFLAMKVNSRDYSQLRTSDMKL